MNPSMVRLCMAGLVAVSISVPAVEVQSTTAAFVSLRSCLAGETACDSIGPSHAKAIGGEPGGQEAQAMQQDPAFGEASGNARLTGAPGAVVMNVDVTSQPAARNAGTLHALQRYTNTSDQAQLLSFIGTLEYEQTVPDGNSAFPADGAAASRVHAELELFRTDLEAFEAGSNAEDNWNLFDGEPPPGYEVLASAEPEAVVSNASAQDSRTFSTGMTLGPGASVWMLVVLQGVAANGAVVHVQLKTSLAVQS